MFFGRLSPRIVSVMARRFCSQMDIAVTLEAKIAALIEYLKVKIEERDWHAVSDAANDLRVLEAQKNRP